VSSSLLPPPLSPAPLAISSVPPISTTPAMQPTSTGWLYTLPSSAVALARPFNQFEMTHMLLDHGAAITGIHEELALLREFLMGRSSQPPPPQVPPWRPHRQRSPRRTWHRHRRPSSHRPRRPGPPPTRRPPPQACLSTASPSRLRRPRFHRGSRAPLRSPSSHRRHCDAPGF
jgi:hypothetical protein